MLWAFAIDFTRDCAHTVVMRDEPRIQTRIGKHHIVRFNPEIVGWQTIDLRVQPKGLVFNVDSRARGVALALKREKE